ncbi:MAG: TolC family outer membrane protein [Notoacmeibacter sp.]|nr:TolC family outer membrane protein [Notoacmeibacter sp.]MCC0031805.1 TolC family outer membrane protein [Brucellaceae bacterium]
MSAVAVLAAVTGFSLSPASAETLVGALTKAYANNSSLNYARAGVRVSDENVALAKSGYRPIVTGSGTVSYSFNGLQQVRNSNGTFGITLSQTLFDGFQTRNNVEAARMGVMASRENLANTGQNILYQAADTYMSVIRDRQIAALRAKNLQFLTEQVRAARSRFDVGEGTRTDVAQAEASNAAAVAQLSAARAQASASEATYRQLVGEAPGKLAPGKAATRAIPASLDSALAMAEANHPAIRANKYLVDAAQYKVKSKEGAFLPKLTAQASVARNYNHSVVPPSTTFGIPNPTHAYREYNTGSISATVTVPLYQGGAASANVRQSKEELGQAQINVDVVRDQVRANMTSAWYNYFAARESLSATGELVNAARLALNGVIEERNVGQRTTLDVLNAQADVITAQLNQIQAEYQLVTASYQILSATGNLTVGKLGLQVAEYKPEEHFEAVEDKWFGLRTPDGR